MPCRKCGSDRIMMVSGKTSDCFYGDYNGYEIDGYVPDDIGIGGNDYIDFNYCMNCGQIVGDWPIEEPDLSEWVKYSDEDE